MRYVILAAAMTLAFSAPAFAGGLDGACNYSRKANIAYKGAPKVELKAKKADKAGRAPEKLLATTKK